MAHHHPFRFGVLGEHIGTRDELIGTARMAEEMGYATFLIRDHFIAPPFGHQLAPFAALATVAAVTERLRIGTLVFANDYRPPVLLAKEAATLDLLSGGRFELGIGTGFLKAEYDQAGIAFDPPGARVDRFAESLTVLKGLFADAPLTFSGAHYALTAFDSFPKPVQRPHPPILVGAGGKRMLSIAAREADIIGILTTSTANGVLSRDPAPRLAAAVERQIGWIREAAGDRFDAIELSLVPNVVIADDYRQAAATHIQARGWSGVSVDDVLAMPSDLIGSVDRVIAQMQARREQYGFSYYVISDGNMEAVAPVVKALAGT
ncbi:MAG: TIGR03621 family F420-dependent LLM class oxidoreductase [Thermomicrobia bacterium]|nr:TIGR03621 family F420-dependent LLM class oxidoreductase [Thermomicrobia bacterium]MCA1724560.1 TIGR03621 family F420-dependent LLM class oxidoreductase [Thermomicrobia bacterium]